MTSVWYVGRSSTRILTIEEWGGLGATAEQDTVWNWANGYSVPYSELTSAQLDILATLDGFLLGQEDGPREYPLPPPNTQAGESAYFRAMRKTYRAIEVIKGQIDSAAAAAIAAASAAGSAVENKVDKVTTQWRIYGTNGTGLPTTFAWNSEATGSSIPIRDINGTFKVGVPSHAFHPWRKTDADAFGKTIAKVAYTGGPVTIQYFEIGRLPVDNSGNAASVTFQGRLGLWSNGPSFWSILLANRSTGYTGLEITSTVFGMGNAVGGFGTTDIEIYSQADKSAIIYLKATAYFACDLRGQGSGYGGTTGTVGLVDEPVTPTGTKIWALSTAPRFDIDSAGQVSSLRIASGSAPSSSTAAGSAGQVRWDANYVYVCVATNTWKRIALTTW